MVLELKKIAEELSDIEAKTLRILEERMLSFNELKRKTDLNEDSLRRAVEWLAEKKLAEIKEEKTGLLELTEKGRKALEKGLIEKRLVEVLAKAPGRMELKELQEKTGLGKEFHMALGKAKENAWIALKKENGKIFLELTGLEKDLIQGKNPLELLIKKIGSEIVTQKDLSEKEKKSWAELKQRNLAREKEIIARKIKISPPGIQVRGLLEEKKEEITVLDKQTLLSGEWKTKKFKKFNLMEPVPEIFLGKKQPYLQFLDSVRRKLVKMGFQELYSPAIVSEFYNFDVLFQPQNHPARTWTDTYKLKKPLRGKLPPKKEVKAVKAAHEYGGISASKGWQYSWSEIIASQLMPAAHTTAYTGMKVAKGLKIPSKYFALSRVYRPDVLDATHLIEFNQLDGIIAGEDLNFRHLLGVLKEFAVEMAGAEKVRFYPDYYPFTEPSVQLSAKHPEIGWIEFAGAGIFRPEMTENLGVKVPVLAWGLGVDRLAMFKLGIKDIRYLFSDNLNWLRKAKIVREE